MAFDMASAVRADCATARVNHFDPPDDSRLFAPTSDTDSADDLLRATKDEFSLFACLALERSAPIKAE
jgi:hypothetical protein